MKTKHLLFALLFVATASSAFAYDFSAVAPSGQTLYYNIVSGHAELTSQNTSSPRYSTYPTGSLVIPSSVTYSGTTYSVTSIGDDAFLSCRGLISVTIPNSVTSIGNSAFSGCSGLTSVTIPNSVTSIDSSAFYIVKNIEYHGSATGAPWGALTLNGVIEGDFIFSDNTHSVLTAYVGNGGNVTIPNSVTSIGELAFYNCSGLTSVTIPNSVTSIGGGAFYGCSGLTSITIPNSVTSIGNSAFYGCSGLTSNVTIPNSVTSIGELAFYNCSGLTSVTIPNSVTNIGEGVFYGCSSLTSVAIGGSVTSIGHYAFYNCSGLTSITIPNSVTSIGYYAFYNCSSLTSVTIPNSVTSIGNYAFFNCSGLTSVTIPDAVTSIGGWAFYNCSGLTSITIPNSVTSIGEGVFYGCSSLTSVAIGGSVTTIDNSAFAGCSSLTYVTFNAINCTSMGSSSYPVFGGCTNLSTLTIGENVTRIPSYAFGNCNSLTSIYMNGFPPTLGTNAIPSTANVHINCIYLQDYQNTWGTSYNYIYPTNSIPDYTISLSVDNSNNGQAVVARAVSCDSTTVIMALDEERTLFDHWNDGNTDNPRTVHLTQDTSFIAYFVPAYYCIPLGFTSQDGWGDVTGNFKAKQGDTVTLTAVPSHGYHFVRWVKCLLTSTGYEETSVTSTQNPLQQVITNQDLYWAVEFAPDTFHVQITVNNDNWGFVNASDDSYYVYGTELDLYAFPSSEMCRFEQWSDGTEGTLVFSGTYWGSRKSVTVTGDLTLQAIFSSEYRTVTAVSSDETLGEIVSGNGEYQYLDTVVLRARPADHHHLTRWALEWTYYEDGTTHTSSTEVWHENPYYMTMPANHHDLTATAYFAIDTHTVSVVSSNMMHGGVEGGGTFEYGTAATVTATPYSGYVFVRWSNGVTYNPYTFAVSADVELTAIFAEQGTVHTITALPDDPTTGSVSGGGQYATGETATLTAVPAEGYHFDHWNDGNTSNPRQVPVVVDATYTAFFVSLAGIEAVDSEGPVIYQAGNSIIVESSDGLPIDNVSVYDAIGRQVYGTESKMSTYRIEVPSHGVYLVRIGDMPARKVVVIR